MKKDGVLKGPQAGTTGLVYEPKVPAGLGNGQKVC